MWRSEDSSGCVVSVSHVIYDDSIDHTLAYGEVQLGTRQSGTECNICRDTYIIHH